MARGKVTTGLSDIVYAKYAASGSTVTYSAPGFLGRARSIDFDLTTADENPYHADNVVAERVPVSFLSGTASIVIDGMNLATEKVVRGLPAATSVGSGDDAVDFYGDSGNAPAIGIGYVHRYMSGGVELYTPVVLTKATVIEVTKNAETQEESISWQNQTVTVRLERDDKADHQWRRIGEDQATQAEALYALWAYFGVTAPSEA